MKVAVTDGKGRLALGTAPRPEWGEYDCLVRTETCAFCNSTDRHIVEGRPPLTPGGPAILGHESVGTVEACGERVRHFSVGDRVLRPMAVWPDEMLGGLASMWGGFAEFAKVRDARAMVEDGLIESIPHVHGYQQKVPPDIALEDALLMTTQKEIWSSVARMGSVRGRRFLVAGAGITALLFGLLLRMKEAAHVTLAARRRGPLEFATEQGSADSTALLPDVEGEFDAMVETTGSVEAAERLLDRIAPGGHIYSYAVYAGPRDDARFDVFRRRHVFQRIDPMEKDAHEDVCRLIREGRLKAAPFVSHRYRLEELTAAWATVVERRTIKTVIFF